MELIQRLRRDHQRIASVLNVLEYQIGQLHEDGDGPDFDLLMYLMDYITEYPDAVHHPLEDQVLDRLANKGLTPPESKLAAIVMNQHTQILASTKAVDSDIRAVVNGAVVPAEQLDRHVSDYLELQRSHMRFEEEHVFPLAEQRLAPEDWRQLEQTIADRSDPMFEKRDARYQVLYQHVVE